MQEFCHYLWEPTHTNLLASILSSYFCIPLKATELLLVELKFFIAQINMLLKGGEGDLPGNTFSTPFSFRFFIKRGESPPRLSISQSKFFMSTAINVGCASHLGRTPLAFTKKINHVPI